MFFMLFWVTLINYLSRMPVSPVAEFEFLIIPCMSNPGHHIQWLNCCVFTYAPDMRHRSIQKWISPGGVFLTHSSRISSVRCQSSPSPGSDVSQVSWQQLEGRKSLIITITPAFLIGSQAISFSRFLSVTQQSRVLLFQTSIIDIQSDSFLGHYPAPYFLILIPHVWVKL